MINKVIQYPYDQTAFDELRAYVSIKMYLLKSGSGLDKTAEIFSQALGSIIDETTNIGKDFIKNPGQFTSIDYSLGKLTNLLKSVKNNKLDISLISKDDKEVFTFNTYIPAEMAMNMISDWAENDLLSKIDLTAKGLTKLAGSLGGAAGIGGQAVMEQYESIKNHLQYYGAIGITPPAVKIFKPSFLDQQLDFEFIPESQEEANDLLIMMKVFKESQIPFSNDGEVFNFPAVFKMEVIPVGDIISNKQDTIADLFLKFENLGLSDFTVTALSGDHVDAKVKQDGKFPGYKVSMKFTTINRIYSNERIQDRIDKYLKPTKG